MLSAPLARPHHRCSATLRTSRSGNSSANCRGRDSSRSMRTGDEELARQLEGCYRLLPGDGGKGIEEVLEGVAGLQVVDQVPDRDSRADEDRRASEDLGIGVHDRAGIEGSLAHAF